MYQSNFMATAAQLAMDNVTSGDGGPFGCVIVKDNQVIAQGHNQVLIDHDPTAHGEIVAIRRAGQVLKTHDLTGCVLYTSAYPCPMCLSAIIWANIKTVYYGNTAKDAAEIGFRDDAIYQYIEAGLEGPTLNLSQHDRSLTLPAFTAYQDQQRTLY
ncbi:nucleoside deaminase [Lacticaseibacillus brantae]|nr:nucleoside deaminase [Lacticaseibacillus brantae]